MWSPHGLKPVHAEVGYGTQAWLLHTLRRGETLRSVPHYARMSFVGYPPRIRPRSQKPCLRAGVRYSTQAWLSA
jgi:hypothetical protein